MAGYDSEGHERLLIEAKFRAGLTRNQPVTYLCRLPDGMATALLFAVPPDRIPEVWIGLKQRISDESSLLLSNEHIDSEVRWASVGEDRKIVLTSWRFLLDNIAAQATSINAQTVGDLHQLQGMVELRGFSSQRPLGTDFPRSLPHLYALVDDTVDLLVARGIAEIPKGAYRPSVQGSYSVKYMTFCGLINSSFGVYFNNWRTYHHGPLSFTVHDYALAGTERVEETLLKEPFRGCKRGTHIYIPIHLHGSNYEAVLQSIVEQVERIAIIINDSHPTSSD